RQAARAERQVDGVDVVEGERDVVRAVRGQGRQHGRAPGEGDLDGGTVEAERVVHRDRRDEGAGGEGDRGERRAGGERPRAAAARGGGGVSAKSAWLHDYLLDMAFTGRDATEPRRRG